ncbi:MAG: c-type cytochrome [Thermodesulfobacteriota bacterium]
MAVFLAGKGGGYILGGPIPGWSQGPSRIYPLSITGDPAKGKVLFRQKGCSTCHAIRGVGGKMGPDLAKLRHFHSVFGMAGILWNHSVHMAAAGKKSRITRPVFKGKELADIIAYLHSLEVIGDPEEGEKLFERKGCASCHRVAGKGGKIAPDLATDHPHPPSELIGLMWNHALVMASVMKALDIPWPVFEAGEMADLLAYIAAAQQARKKPAIRRPGKR